MDEFESNLEKIKSLEEINEEKEKIEKNITTVKLCLKNRKNISNVLVAIDAFLLIFGVVVGFNLNTSNLLFDILAGIVISEALGNLVLYAARFGDIPAYYDKVIEEVTEGVEYHEFIENKTKELEEINSKYPNMQEKIDELKTRNTILTKESIQEKLKRNIEPIVINSQEEEKEVVRRR